MAIFKGLKQSTLSMICVFYPGVIWNRFLLVVSVPTFCFSSLCCGLTLGIS